MTFAIVRDVSSSGKGIPRKKILRYDHFHFLSAHSAENKSGSIIRNGKHHGRRSICGQYQGSGRKC